MDLMHRSGSLSRNAAGYWDRVAEKGAFGTLRIAWGSTRSMGVFQARLRSVSTRAYNLLFPILAYET